MAHIIYHIGDPAMTHGTRDVREPYTWDDLSFTFLTGRDVEQIFDAPEYIILPSMMTSTAGPGRAPHCKLIVPNHGGRCGECVRVQWCTLRWMMRLPPVHRPCCAVFATSSFDTGRMGEYASFHRTLVQTKDLMCVLLTEVLGVVRPGDLAALMRLVVELARVEGEQMGRRRMDDTEGYVRLRESAARMLLALQALAAATTATPAPQPDDDDDDDDGKSQMGKDPYASEESEVRMVRNRVACQIGLHAKSLACHATTISKHISNMFPTHFTHISHTFKPSCLSRMTLCDMASVTPPDRGRGRRTRRAP